MAMSMTGGQETGHSRLVEEILQYRGVFEHSPAALWIEDASLLQVYFSALRDCGVEDFGEYLSEQPEALRHCLDMVVVCEVNQAARQLFGASGRQDFMECFWASLSPAGQEGLRHKLVALAEGRRRVEFAAELRTGDNGPRRVLVVSELQGEPGQGDILVACQDISPWHVAKRTLGQRSLDNRLRFESLPAKIFAFASQNGRMALTDANRAALEGRGHGLLGQGPEEVFAGLPEVAQALQSFARGADRDEMLLAGDERLEIRLGRGLRGEVIVLALDRGERRRQETDLRRQRDRLQGILDALPAAVYWKDRSLAFKGVNRRLLLLAGFAVAARVLDRRDAEIFPEEFAVASEAQDHQLLAGQLVRPLLQAMRRADGKAVQVLHAKVPLAPDADGRPAGVLGLLVELPVQGLGGVSGTDVAGQLPLAELGHDLRSPLNAILGLAELCLEDDADPAARRSYLEMIRGSATAMRELLDNLVDMSRLASGRLRLCMADFDLGGLLKEVVREQAVATRNRPVRVRLNLDPGLPRMVSGDRARLRQVLANLVGNAVKFTLEGEVAVSAKAGQTDGGRMMLRVGVRDTGPGIPAERLEDIFAPFSRVENGNARPGAGLGLAISRQLVEAMGGRLQVRSRMGRGSLFSFEAPLGVPVAATPPPEAKTPATRPSPPAVAETPVAAGLRILLVEDDRISRTFEGELLQRLGHRVRSVENGPQALEALALERFDLVLMDVQLPDMDGLEVSARIRRGEGVLDPGVPIVCISAHAMLEQAERSSQLGLSAYLSKPIHRETLVRAIAVATAGRNPGSPMDDAGPAGRQATAATGVPEASEALAEALDLAFLRRNHQNDSTLIQAMASLYAQATPQQVEELRVALDAGQWSRLAAMAHRLAGSAGSVGANRLRGLGLGLQEAAQRQDVALVKVLLQDFQQEHERVLDALEAESRLQEGPGS